MAQFRTTADILDSILRRAGEVTNGNSAFESDALEYLNRVHHNILAGGSVFNMEVDEAWTWAHSKCPIILELQPAYESGTVSVTNGSEAGSFSSAPTSSYEGWHMRVGDDPEVYRIAQHTANSANFELDAPYVGSTAAAASHKTMKLEYELVAQTLTVDSSNNKINFTEPGGTSATGTLTSGVYTPADIAAEVTARLEAVGTSALDVTTAYDSTTRKFTITVNDAESQLEQSLNDGNDTLLGSGSTSNDRRAQQFEVSTGFTTDELGLMLWRSSGATGTVRFAIQADNGSNVPDGTDLATFDVDLTTLPTSASSTFTYYSLSANVAFSNSTKYFIVAKRQTALSNSIFIEYASSLASDGLVNISSADAGSTWGSDITSQAWAYSFKDVSPKISIQFASGDNASNSSAELLGFDDEDQALANTHTSQYALSGISRLIEPFRVQRHSREDSQIYGLDKLRFEEEYPVHKVREAIPCAFTKIREDQDGKIWVRFDSYPKEARRLEINYIPVPRDLKDNAVSRPLLPRKDIDVLEYGTAFYLLLDKEDTKADTYGNLARQGLKSMEKRNRNELRKVDANFGEIITRPEYLEKNFRKLRYGYTSGE